MNIDTGYKVTHINITFHNDGSRVLKNDQKDIKNLRIPAEIKVDGKFSIEFNFENASITFELNNGFKNESAKVHFLYSLRSKRYPEDILKAFANVFTELSIQNYEGETYLGYPNGEGYFTLTPFIIETMKNARFLGYFIFYVGSDGESRHEPMPSILKIGNLYQIKNLIVEFEEFRVK